jgi:lysophospholipase L1-like esterase
MLKKLAFNLCSLLVGTLSGIVLSLVFLEIVLRIYNPIIETVKGDKVVLRANYDDIRRYHTPGLAPEVRIHQNSLGFRGPDPPADFADRLTIITIGGSTTHQVSQPDDLTWTALLGDAVADCFDRTWINNAGFEGHSSFAHLQLIRGYINKLHPKVAVLLIGINEILKSEAGISEPNSYDREQVVSDLDFKWGIKGFLKGLSNRSEVVDLSLTLYRSFYAWKFGQNNGIDWTSVTEGNTMPADAQAKLVAMKDKQPAYASRLRAIIRLLRDGQTVPVLVTQPTVVGVGRDPTTGKDLARINEGLYWYKALDTYNDTMRDVAESEHVHLIDLAHMMPKDTKYYWDMIHYTDAGSKEVAHLITIGILPYLAQKFPSYRKSTCEMGSANPE